jgi:hypothetical protein
LYLGCRLATIMAMGRFWRWWLVGCLAMAAAAVTGRLAAPRPLSDRFDRLAVGMTEQQVLEILGPPDKRVWVDADKSVWWTWHEPGRDGTIENGTHLGVEFKDGQTVDVMLVGPNEAIPTPLGRILRSVGLPSFDD